MVARLHSYIGSQVAGRVGARVSAELFLCRNVQIAAGGCRFGSVRVSSSDHGPQGHGL